MAPWLELYSNAPGLPGPYMREFLAPYQILDELKAERPRTVQLIGGMTKWEYTGGSHSINDYRVHLRRLNKKGAPLLGIDCCTHWCPEPKRMLGGPKSGTSSYHLLKGGMPRADCLVTTVDLFSRLLGVLSLVVVIFIDDISLPRGVIDFLAHWIRRSQSDQKNRPRIILFQQKLFAYLIEILRISDPATPFSIAELKSQQEFWAMLFRHTQECASQRQDDHYDFNARHLKIIFRYVIEHYAANTSTRLEFPLALRQASSFSAHLPRHLSCLLQELGPQRSEIAVTIIASALCVDAYEPEMHNFLPNYIFDCAYKSAFSSLRRSDLYERIKYQFALTAFENQKAEASAFRAHIRRLGSFACPLCLRLNDAELRLYPATAQKRVLVINGDLQDKTQISQFLSRLGFLIALTDFPFREHFDRVYASGVGLYFASSIFGNKRSLSKTVKSAKDVIWVQENRWNWKRQCCVKFSPWAEMNPQQLCRDNEKQLQLRTRKRLYTNFTESEEVPPGPALVDLMIQMKDAHFTYRGDEMDYLKSKVFDQKTARDCRDNIPYKKQITFSVFSMKTAIDVKVQVGEQIHSICKCPYELRSLIRDQQMDCLSSDPPSYLTTEDTGHEMDNLQVILGRVAKFTLSGT
ncbi:RING finger domain protein [Apiospora arundinis]|uniref:RING finger domain protein n=1 Tax=Apiospora arundinis TaxID=335852 RepID=A0ABR2HZ32_9PEZI